MTDTAMARRLIDAARPDATGYAQISTSDLEVLEAYKASLFLEPGVARYVGSNKDDAGAREDWRVWRLADGDAEAHLIFGGDDSYHASVYMKGEPHWREADDYEAHADQFRVIFASLPGEAIDEFLSCFETVPEELAELDRSRRSTMHP